jgi:hypothetical protein
MWRARCECVSRDRALGLVVTSPHPPPRLRPRLFPLVALRSAIKFFPSAITGATVFTSQSIPSLCAARKSAATYAATSPTTDIAVTSMSAHLERNLTQSSNAGDEAPLPSLSQSTAGLPQAATSPCIHQLLRTRNSRLFRNCATHLLKLTNTPAQLLHSHAQPSPLLQRPRWFASDTDTYSSLDRTSFFTDDTPPLL